MKRLTVTIAAALLALSAPMAVLAKPAPAAATQQAAQALDHEQTFGGVRVTFKFVGMKEMFKAKNVPMPAGLKDTHHLKVDFLDAKTGKPFTEGEAKVKVQGPDKTAQVKDLMAMNNRFCADFDLSKKGKYGVMTKFQLKGGEVQSVKFWYDVK